MMHAQCPLPVYYSQMDGSIFQKISREMFHKRIDPEFPSNVFTHQCIRAPLELLLGSMILITITWKSRIS